MDPQQIPDMSSRDEQEVVLGNILRLQYNIVAPNAFCTVWLSSWNIMSVFRVFQVPRRHAVLVATSVMAPWLVGARLVTQIHLELVVQARYLFIDFALISSYITSVYCKCLANFMKNEEDEGERNNKSGATFDCLINSKITHVVGSIFILFQTLIFCSGFVVICPDVETMVWLSW